MNTFNYFDFVFNNLELYLISVLIVLIVYYFFFRKYFISILDPLTYTFFFSSMAITVPVFLFLTNEINSRIFYSFLFTQLSFFIGFRVFPPIKLKTLLNKNVNKLLITAKEIRLIKWFFIVTGFFTIILQLFSYKFFGIPLFSEYRLAIYGESGGISNLLKRVIEVSLQCYIFLTIYFINYKHKRLFFKYFTRLSVILLVIFSVLSGSKGAFISFGLAFFIYALYSMKWGDTAIFKKINFFTLKFGVVALFIAIIVVLLSENGSNPLNFLLMRIAQSGDVYYMAYPNEILDKIPSANWFLSLFASPLSLLGLISRSDVPYPMGFFLMEYHNPGIEFKGPNARMNVFSYVYFGILYSPVYCFVIGVILSFVRNKLFYLLPSSILGCILYFLLLSAALKIETDFHSFLADFINIIVILPFFLFISYIFVLSSRTEL